MKKSICTFLLISFLSPQVIGAGQREDYRDYHLKIMQAEELIAEKSFQSALNIYQEVFSSYPFVFLRDCKNASQVAWYIGDESKTCEFVKHGIKSGWKMKEIKKHNSLKGLTKTKGFQTIRVQYDSLYELYSDRINPKLRWEVRKMSWKDQWGALMALFRFSEKAQAKYGERKFAPKNELRLRRVLEIVEDYGYPGERLIGNAPWMMGIVGRRNQISQEFCREDTIYQQQMKPILLTAITKGEMNPAYYAFIDDWFITCESGWEKGSYGFLAELKPQDIQRSNQLRKEIGLRTVETHNSLIDIQKQTGMWFYLWPRGSKKIPLAE